MMKDNLEINDYLAVLKKRRWTVLTAFLVVFLSVAVATFIMTPVYKASAQVYIDPGANAQYSFQQTPYTFDSTSYLQTQIGILKSDTIARKVIEKLNLVQQKDDGFNLLGLVGIGSEPRSGEDAVEKAMKKFNDGLEVESVKNSNLLKVSYTDKNPELSANVVNATVQTFIEQNLEMRVAPAKMAMNWLNEKLNEMKGKMETSSSSLQDFKQQKDLIVTGDKQTNISLQALTDMNTQALGAEARRVEAEIKYQQVKDFSKSPDKLMALPIVLNDKVVQDLKTQQMVLMNQMAEMSKKYGEKHPQIVRLRNELAGLQQQMRDEVNIVVSSLKNDYDVALKSEQSLKAALARQKGEAMSYQRRSNEYDIMQQDVDGARKVYDMVLQKFQESNVMGNSDMSNVQLLDKAVPPKLPYKPNKPLNLLIGLLLGGIAGVCVAFGFEFVDNTFKSPEDVEDYLGLPFLGVIPTASELVDKGGEENILSLTSPTSAVAESFRNIRGNMLLSTGDVRPKVIQVCSALHSEGKSTVSVNLACIMAAAGEKVLLVDADMRKPRLHRAFKVPNTVGLSTILAKQGGVDAALKDVGTENLSFIPSGPVSPNPGELLCSKTMRDTISALGEKYDRIILDCPPYLGLADSSLMTPYSDGVLLVVRSGKTAKDMVMKAKKGMDTINAKIFGVVLNDVNAGAGGYYYGYYNYSYYYSDKEAKSSKASRPSKASKA